MKAGDWLLAGQSLLSVSMFESGHPPASVRPDDHVPGSLWMPMELMDVGVVGGRDCFEVVPGAREKSTGSPDLLSKADGNFHWFKRDC